MLCKIADLIVEIPEVGDLVPRCQEYLCQPADETVGADITIRTDKFRPEIWTDFSENAYFYMESGAHFHANLWSHHGFVLHASAVALDGKAYLFSAPCGTGKSTHTRLWQATFGPEVLVFNDDKPALRLIDGRWYAYGTPWCGKDGININMKTPLAGICFLKQAPENRIIQLSQSQAIQKILWQSAHRFNRLERMDQFLASVDSLVRSVPVFELENRPEPDAARLSYETMRRKAEEMGL